MAQTIYVAGGYKHRIKIRAFVCQLEVSGMFQQQRRWFDVESGQETPAESAHADLEAVRAADLVVAVMDDPEYAYRGTWTEVGAALALQKPVVIIGPNTTESARNVFWHHKDVRHVPTIEDFVHTTMIDAIRR